MQLLVVITTKEYELWEKFLQRPDRALIKADKATRDIKKGASDVDANVIKFDLDSSNCTMVMLQEETKNRTTDLLTTLLEWAKDNISPEVVYIAYHKGFVDWSILRRNLPDMKIWGADFIHEQYNDIFKTLKKLAQELDNESFETICSLIKKKQIIEPISFLKHRIAHCFLSIDLDLQSAKEEGEYLKDILSTKQEGYYTNKLNQARCYTVGGNWCDSAEKWGKEQNQSFQPPDNYILDLLGDSPPKEWSTVCTLLGLSESDYSEEIESSPIAKFFKKLEEKREKDSIDEDNVDDILNYFTKHISPNGWHVSEANPSYIKSFHDWCCALDDALDRLRASLLSSNRAKGN